ncbi:MAG: ComEC/Rec2 family competence protein [Streptococcus sp.]
MDKEFDEQSQLYTSLGIIHLFCAIGYAGWIFLLAGFAMDFSVWGFPKNYILAILLPFSIFYGLMTGWTASVLRSLIQILLAECGIKKLNNMGITLLLFFLVLPHFLLTVGGVLSCFYAFLLCLFNFEEMPSF